MNRTIGPLRLTFLLAMAILLWGCSAKLTTGTSADDETAVRQTLARVERRINQGDLAFVDVFAKDAVIIAPSVPDIVGSDAIRAMYAGLMEKTSMNVRFSTEEVAIAGDLAYEHGTYTLRMIDKGSGQIMQDVKNKHVHIMKRQPDGSWRTWRMMVNSSEPTPSNK